MRYRIIWLVSVLFKYGGRPAYASTYLRLWKNNLRDRAVPANMHWGHAASKTHFSFKYLPQESTYTFIK